MNFTIDTRDLQALRADLAGFSDRRFESALAEALNNTARGVQREWQNQLRGRFDRPTPLTKGAATRTRADVGRLAAEVALKSDVSSSGRGDAPDEYLVPQEAGGDRRLKKFERALVSGGAMPADSKTVPGKYARLDNFGNVSRGQIVQVLNQLGRGLSVGYARVISASAGKRTQSAARAGRVYVSIPRPKDGLAAGIYQRHGRALLPVFFFVPSVSYRRRLNIMQEGGAIVRKQLSSEVGFAVQRRFESLLRRNSIGRP